MTNAVQKKMKHNLSNKKQFVKQKTTIELVIISAFIYKHTVITKLNKKSQAQEVICKK